MNSRKIQFTFLIKSKLIALNELLCSDYLKQKGEQKTFFQISFSGKMKRLFTTTEKTDGPLYQKILFFVFDRVQTNIFCFSSFRQKGSARMSYLFSLKLDFLV
jgi:hypothetical protein